MIRTVPAKIRETAAKQIKSELMGSLLHINNNNLITITEQFPSKLT